MGILYIVATPLGNLKDITERALETLRSVDLVVCEDTRQTIKLLNHYQIKKPLMSYFQHSKLSKIEYIARQLAEGKNIALVTDAGTPGISDPGNKLIEQLLLFERGAVGAESRTNNLDSSTCVSPEALARRASSRNKLSIKIVPIPGPCAAIAALSVSGFPTDKFVFMGFPPHKKGRQKYFDEVVGAGHTVVFYESPHRILRGLEDLKLAFIRAEISVDSRDLVVCRELTKMFESVYRGTAEEILNILNSDKNNLKGEFVVIVKK
ncbi:rRNA small subunit methyltransferase 1 [Patescibacteria group bacterium]|nr:rRNA small subunit methyltransferase 1 [Patescibacteria group bacterium]